MEGFAGASEESHRRLTGASHEASQEPHRTLPGASQEPTGALLVVAGGRKDDNFY